ncbi:MAG: hypothetical protein AB7N76_00825 [Planctomycetota bacterium]
MIEGEVDWFFVPLPPAAAIGRAQVTELAKGLFTMQLCWDAPGGAPERLRPGISVRAWLRPGSLVGVVLERTPEGLALGLPAGAAPSDWGLGMCLAVGLARAAGAQVRTPEGEQLSPEQLLSRAEPPLLWKRWVGETEEVFAYVKEAGEILVLEGLRRLHVGRAVTKTCRDAPDPPRMLLRVLNRSTHLIGLERFNEAARTLNEEAGRRWHSVAVAPERALVLRDPEYLELEGTPAGSFLPLPRLQKAVGQSLEQLDELTFALPAIPRAEWPRVLERAQPLLLRIP